VQANTTIAHYKLYSISGQILKEDMVSSKTFNVDMSALNPAVYFIEFLSSSNQKETIQIIKK
ncbi:MAG: T9SS type A sorting domain-containing protein, partial [Flavobacteriaceae bacterium]